MPSEQWRTGLIDTITNGSQIVIGTASCDWANQVSAGHVFKVDLDGESTYVIGTVVSASRIILSANYTGTTGTGLSYMAMRSFTSRGYWRVLAGDYDFAEILSQNTIDKIDTDIADLSASANINESNIINANASITGLKANVVNINASITENPVLKTANYQVTIFDNTILGSGDITVTLASASSKHRIEVANRSLDSNASIVVQKSGGDTIEGDTSIKMKNKYDSIVLLGDGTNTHIQF